MIKPNRFLTFMKDVETIQGDMIDFRIFDPTNFIAMTKFAHTVGKKTFGLETCTGLAKPCKDDWEENGSILYTQGRFETQQSSLVRKVQNELKEYSNYKLIIGPLIESFSQIDSQRFSLALIDLIQYEPTKSALNFIWDRMSSGGCMILENFNGSRNRLASKAIKEFLEEKASEMITTKQMLVNGDPDTTFVVKKVGADNIEDYITITELDRPLNIVCVLRSGGVYNAKYVNALANAVKRHVSVKHKFVCLTDNAEGFNSNVDKIISLKHNFPKWWSKIELFRDDLFVNEQIFFIDLDTVIINNIDNIVQYSGDFCGLRDFYHLVTLGSGLMSWKQEKMTHVYHRFLEKSTYIMNNSPGGDQQFIDSVKPSIDFFQDKYHNQVVSFKKHCVAGNSKIVNIPKAAKIVCFHGVPKPHDILDPSIADHWKE